MPATPKNVQYDITGLRQRMEERRAAPGLSMSEVSARAGLKATGYRDTVARNRAPTLLSAVGFAKSLVCSVAFLIGEDDPSHSSRPDLHEQLEEVIDLLHALDKIGDGIGGADGYAVSAVATQAKSVAENVLPSIRSREAV